MMEAKTLDHESVFAIQDLTTFRVQVLASAKDLGREGRVQLVVTVKLIV